MYYIEQELKMSKGVISIPYYIHTTTSFTVDLLNREITLYLASYQSFEDLAKSYVGRDSTVNVNFTPLYLKYNTFDFASNPMLFALQLAISDTNSVFYKAEIKRLYQVEEYLNSLLSTPESIEERDRPKNSTLTEESSISYVNINKVK